MNKVEIHAIGRIKEVGLRELIGDYGRRCRRTLDLVEHEHKDLKLLIKALPSKAWVVALDECGARLDSQQFAARLRGWLRRPGVSRLVFIIGGADGLDALTRARADEMLSLSALTFSHRLARLLLAEQLYRAVSIIEGTPYHRQ